MGKSIPAAHRFQHFAKVIASTSTSLSLRRPTQSSPTAKISLPMSSSHPGPESRHRLKLNNRDMEAAENSERQRRVPLAEVVNDCVNRWFQDTLKEAKAGDTAMQVLVGQMYYSGYGVARDAQKILVLFSSGREICSVFLYAYQLMLYPKIVHEEPIYSNGKEQEGKSVDWQGREESVFGVEGWR